jgi:hypothetical protein
MEATPSPPNPNAPREERISAIYQDFWLDMPQPCEVLTRLEALLARPYMQRSLGLLVTAEPSMGKTAIAHRFQQLHPPELDPQQEFNKVPVLMIQLTSTNVASFYESILVGLRVTMPRHESLLKLKDRTEKYLHDLGVRLLLIDEFNNAANGSAKEHLACMAAVRGLTTLRKDGMHRGIMIAAFGTDEATRLLSWDPQLETRLLHNIKLKPLGFGREFVRLLKSLEEMWPLKNASNLHQSPLAETVHQMTGGLTGEVVELIRSATILAINNHTERITPKLVTELGWVPPKQRRSGLVTSPQGQRSHPAYPTPPAVTA